MNTWSDHDEQPQPAGPADGPTLTGSTATGSTATGSTLTGSTATGSTAGSVGTVAAAPRRTVRMRTVVFGLVLLGISVMALLTLVTDVHVDRGAVALVLLIGAGAALVAGGLGAAVREARGGPGA